MPDRPRGVPQASWSNVPLYRRVKGFILYSPIRMAGGGLLVVAAAAAIWAWLFVTAAGILPVEQPALPHTRTAQISLHNRGFALHGEGVNLQPYSAAMLKRHPVRSTRAFIGRWPQNVTAGAAAAIFVIGFIVSKPVAREVLTLFAKSTAWYRDMKAKKNMGLGGQAGFGGFLEELCCRYKTGDWPVGLSAHDPAVIVGVSTDRGGLQLGAARSGKQRAGTLVAALMWIHSLVIVDTKGQHTAVCEALRGRGGGRVPRGMGQPAFRLDPMHRVGEESDCYNPLDFIDSESLTIFEDLEALGDAIVIPSPHAREPHWDNSSRELLVGLMHHGVTAYEDKASLPLIRDWVNLSPDDFKDLLLDMYNNKRAGGMASSAAARILRGDDSEEIRNILSNLASHTACFQSPAIRNIMMDSSFSLDDFKYRPSTLHIIMPPDDLGTHAAFVRLIVNQIMRTCSKRRSQVPFGLILDEAFNLGHQRSLTRQIASIPGFNVRLNMCWQDWSQCLELYGRNASTFDANSGFIQIMSASDALSQAFAQKKLGTRNVWTLGSIKNVPLLEAYEIEKLTDKDGMCIVTRNGKSPLLLRKLHYDIVFPKRMFNRDPEHTESWGHAMKRLWYRISTWI